MKTIEKYIKKITNHVDPEYDWLDECLLNQLNIYHNFNLLTITESMILKYKGSFSRSIRYSKSNIEKN